MQGRRVADYTAPHLLEPGDYSFYPEAHPENNHYWPGKPWLVIRTPNGIAGSIITHTIVEHEDKTISVSPSILCDHGDEDIKWHGFLEYGIWREC